MGRRPTIDGPDDVSEWLSSVSTSVSPREPPAPPLVGQVIEVKKGYASITVVERSIATETVRFGLPNGPRAIARFARDLIPRSAVYDVQALPESQLPELAVQAIGGS